MTVCHLQEHAPIHAQLRRQSNKDESHANTCTNTTTNGQKPLPTPRFMCMCTPSQCEHTVKHKCHLCSCIYLRENIQRKTLIIFFLCSFSYWVERTLIQSSQIETTTFRCRTFNCSNILFCSLDNCCFFRLSLSLSFGFRHQWTALNERSHLVINYSCWLFWFFLFYFFFFFLLRS